MAVLLAQHRGQKACPSHWLVPLPLVCADLSLKSHSVPSVHVSVLTTPLESGAQARSPLCTGICSRLRLFSRVLEPGCPFPQSLLRLGWRCSESAGPSKRTEILLLGLPALRWCVSLGLFHLLGRVLYLSLNGFCISCVKFVPDSLKKI